MTSATNAASSGGGGQSEASGAVRRAAASAAGPQSKSPERSWVRRAFYEFIRALCWALFLLVHRLRVYHAERVPASGPLLIAANHQSYYDPPVLGAAVRSRHLSFLARSGLFKVPGLRWMIAALNAVPIRENTGDAAAIREILARLDTGEAVVIFPEGSRTPDGEIHVFKRGVALMVRRARCPVVPVAIHGAFDAFPRTRRFPMLFGPRISVIFGEPIAYDDLMRDGPDAGLKRIEDEVRRLREELLARSAHVRDR
jgi:1-acyl-sn-glycerol-3-phosphate acyltransferase